MVPYAVDEEGREGTKQGEAVSYRVPGLQSVLESAYYGGGGAAAATAKAVLAPEAATAMTTPSSVSSSLPPSPFGPIAARPVMKERTLDLQTYMLFALAGAVGCAGTHSLVVPIGKKALLTFPLPPSLPHFSLLLHNNPLSNPPSIPPSSPPSLDVAQDQSSYQREQDLHHHPNPPSLPPSLPPFLDVVKTKAQTSGGKTSIIEGVRTLAREEGIEGLTRGIEPTILGYTFYGVTVYPGYEFFKRALNSAGKEGGGREGVG